MSLSIYIIASVAYLNQVFLVTQLIFFLLFRLVQNQKKELHLQSQCDQRFFILNAVKIKLI